MRALCANAPPRVYMQDFYRVHPPKSPLSSTAMAVNESRQSTSPSMSKSMSTVTSRLATPFSIFFTFKEGADVGRWFVGAFTKRLLAGFHVLLHRVGCRTQGAMQVLIFYLNFSKYRVYGRWRCGKRSGLCIGKYEFHGISRGRYQCYALPCY